MPLGGFVFLRSNFIVSDPLAVASARRIGREEVSVKLLVRSDEIRRLLESGGCVAVARARRNCHHRFFSQAIARIERIGPHCVAETGEINRSRMWSSHYSSEASAA